MLLELHRTRPPRETTSKTPLLVRVNELPVPIVLVCQVVPAPAISPAGETTTWVMALVKSLGSASHVVFPFDVVMANCPLPFKLAWKASLRELRPWFNESVCDVNSWFAREALRPPWDVHRVSDPGDVTVRRPALEMPTVLPAPDVPAAQPPSLATRLPLGVSSMVVVAA